MIKKWTLLLKLQLRGLNDKLYFQMKPEDLRMGNYVLYKGKVWYISSIGIYSIVVSWTNDDWGARYSEIQPITLTEEWLLKFGFEKEGKWLYHSQHFVKFKFRKDGTIWRASVVDSSFGSGFSRSKNNRLMYVHQLQNLYFALTGQELTLSTV